MAILQFDSRYHHPHAIVGCGDGMFQPSPPELISSRGARRSAASSGRPSPNALRTNCERLHMILRRRRRRSRIPSHAASRDHASRDANRRANDDRRASHDSNRGESRDDRASHRLRASVLARPATLNSRLAERFAPPLPVRLLTRAMRRYRRE